MNHSFSNRGYAPHAKGRFELIPRGHAYHPIPTGASSYPAPNSARLAPDAYHADSSSDLRPPPALSNRPPPQSRTCAFVCMSLVSSALGATAALLLVSSSAQPYLQESESASMHTTTSQLADSEKSTSQRVPESSDVLLSRFSTAATYGLDKASTASSFPQWHREKAQGRRTLLLDATLQNWNTFEILNDVVRVTAHLARASLQQRMPPEPPPRDTRNAYPESLLI